MESNFVIALEIGSSKAKAGAAVFNPRLGAESPVTVLAVSEEALENSVRFGRVQNVEDVSKNARLAIERLEGDHSIAPRKVTGVYVALGGRSLGSRTASVQLPLPGAEETEITAEIIDRLKDDAVKQAPANREVLDIIPVSFMVDGISTVNPVGSFGRSIAADFTIVTCDPINLRNLNRVVFERMGLDICGIVVRPLAIGDLVLTVEEKKKGCMLVDFGAETTTVAIYKDQALRYIATIPLGSALITRDLSEGLGVLEEEAEKIKRNMGNAMTDSAVQLSAQQREIDNFVQARVAEIIANITAQIGFADYCSADLRSGIVLTGHGSKLRNFAKLLEIQSNMTVRTAGIPPYVRLADSSVNIIDNIDITAVLTEGARLAISPEAIACVSEPEPEPVREHKPAEHEPAENFGLAEENREDPADAADAEVSAPAQPRYEMPDHSGFDIDDDTNPFSYKGDTGNSAPSRRRRSYSDDELLSDDDEVEASRLRRQQEAERKHQEELDRLQKKIKAMEEEKKREAEKKRKRDAENENPDGTQPGRASLWNSIYARMAKLIQDTDGDDGADLQDDTTHGRR